MLLRCFYVGITTWYRFILDTITGVNFLMSPPFDALNAMGNSVDSPPLMVSETILTLEHVMERLDAIEKKMSLKIIWKLYIKICIILLLNLGQKWSIFLSC